MNAKLTLSLDKDVIDQAKEFARLQHKSLSSLVEIYLARIAASGKPAKDITPLVAELSGVIKEAACENHKIEYSEYLERKYR